MPDMSTDSRRAGSSPPADTASAGRDLRRTMLHSVLMNTGVPALLFVVLRHPLSNDALALAVSGAWPAGRFVVALVRRRPIDPLAVMTTVAFAVALVVYVLTGGNPLAIELHEAVLTGSVGLVTLVAVGAGLRVEHALARLSPQAGAAAAASGSVPCLRGAVVVAASTLLVHAIAVTALALTVPVAHFVVLSRVIGLSILALGAAAVAFHLRHDHRMSR